MRNCILSAFADEYAAPFADQLDGLRRFDIGQIELRHLDGRNISTLSAEEIAAVGRQLKDCGIAVSAIGSPIGKIALDGDLEAHFRMAEHVFAAAARLETRYVRIFSFYPSAGKQITAQKSEVTAALERLLRLAQTYGVTLCHENEARIYGDTPQRCRELIDHFDGAIKCVFDMGNFVLEGVTPYPDAYRLLQKDIAYFHIKDALAQGAIVPPGKGEAQIKAILTAHRQFAAQDFVVSLEPHLQTFSGRGALVGRSFENPYQYEDEKAAFADAVTCFRELFA